MTRTFTAKIELCCWKSHACAQCGCRYAYFMIRKVGHGGASQEQATEKAQAAGNWQLASEVEWQPCPTCGLYQPDMIARRRRRWHLRSAPLIFLAFFILGGLFLADVIQARQALAFAIAGISIAGIVGFFIDGRSPNFDRGANCGLAEKEIVAERLRTIEPGDPQLASQRSRRMKRPSLLAWLFIGLALVAVAFPELARRQSGWAYNTAWHPSVVGPGEISYVYLPDSVASIKGLWRGRVEVTVRDVGDPASLPIRVASATRQATWPASGKLESSDVIATQRLWVRLKLPANVSLTGKTLVCAIQLVTEYPWIGPDNTRVDKSESFINTQELTLAIPRASFYYRVWWCVGYLTGVFLVGMSILARLRAAETMRRQVIPPEIVENSLSIRPCSPLP